MRRLTLLFLALLVSGCTIPTEPNYPQTVVGNPVRYDDFYLDHSPIPVAYYDGLFVVQLHNYDYLDSAGMDVSNLSYESQSVLYNELHNMIDIPSEGLTIQVDGASLPFERYYQYDTNIHLNFPSPVSWIVSGDNYFPPFSHIISSENPIDILSPSPEDSLDAHTGFDLSYSALGAESVTISLLYDGTGIFKDDTSNQVREYLDNRQLPIANTGQYAVPEYLLDSSYMKTFTPQSVLISVAWAQGDTIHVAGKIFGFVTEVSNSREYYFKQ